MTAALVGLVAVPVLAGSGLLVTGRPASRVAAPVAIVAAAVALVLAVLVAVGRPAVSVPFLAGIDAGLAVDGLSAVMVLTVTGITLAVVAFAAAQPEPDRHRFFGLLLLFAAAMLVTVTATDLLMLLAAWEVMGAMSYALIAHRYAQPRPPSSGAAAFLVTRGADVGLYVAAGAALAGGVGTLALADLPRAGGGWLDLLTAGLVLAALGKSAQLPFSFWLSRAMDGPSPVSALLHSATMVAAGGYLLLRLEPLLRASAWAGPVVAWTGAATVVGLGLVALAQTDLKQLLAASTCSQIGFIVLAAGVGGTAGGTLQLVAHAATKSLLFLVAGAWLTALGTKQLAALRGVARRWPLVGLVFAAGALSLAGVPPLSIFFGKDAVLAAAAATSTPLYAAGLLGVVLSAGYAAGALAVVLGGPGGAGVGRGAAPGRATAGWDAAGRDADGRPTGDVPARARAPLVVLVLAATTLGVAGEPVRAALDASGEAVPGVAEAVLSGVLSAAVVVGVLAAARRGRLPDWTGVAALRGWLGLEWLAVRGVAGPTMALARGLSVFDGRVVDGAVWLAAATARAAARLAHLRVDALIGAAVRVVGAAARSLGRLARRPQTGLLHQYYAQAVGALAVLALFLLIVR